MTRSAFLVSAILLNTQIAFAEPASKVAVSAAEIEWHVHDIVNVDLSNGGSRSIAPQPNKIAAEVVQIRPNGDLVIKGRCKFLDEDQIWEKSISGEVPRKSIGRDRTVNGEKLSNFKMTITCQPTGIIDRPAANSTPPQPVKLVAAQAPMPPKIDELRKKVNELNRLQAEVRRLRAETGTQQQILVRLQVLEVSLTKLRQLGTDVNFFGSSTVQWQDTKSLTKAIGTSGANTPTDSTAKNDALAGFINWLMENNIARVLSEPNIVMLDGRPASFNVGGEIPIPARDDSKNAVEFRPFGTQVDIVPTTQGNNRVRLELRARVSEIDDARSIKIGDSRVPGITVRQCDTAVETEFGKSVVLNGITERREKATKHDGGRVTNEIVDVALLFVVTPELVDAPTTASMPHHRPAPK